MKENLSYYWFLFSTEAATRGVLWTKVFLEISQNLQENTCARPEACNFIKKETLAQAFCCELYEISKNILFIEHLCTTAFISMDFLPSQVSESRCFPKVRSA